MLRRLFLLLGVTLSPGFAAPVFTWSFTPESYTVAQTGTVAITATLVNTGATNITGLAGYFAYVGTIEPFISDAVFGTTGSPSFEAQFAGIDLAPTDQLTFTFVTLTFANALMGTYTGLRDTDPQFILPSLALSDAVGSTPLQMAENLPILDVVATPEPSSFILVLAGCAGYAAMWARRRTRS